MQQEKTKKQSTNEIIKVVSYFEIHIVNLLRKNIITNRNKVK